MDTVQTGDRQEDGQQHMQAVELTDGHGETLPRLALWGEGEDEMNNG